MDWAQALTALVLVVVGLAFVFAGYRLFRILIPIWGFIVGFDLAVAVTSGALHTQALATPLDWIVPIVVGLIFAALAYAYYYVSVVVLAVSVGYLLGQALATAFAPQASVSATALGVIGAIVLAGVTIALNLPKAMIVVLTALGGASAAVMGALLALGKISLPPLQPTSISDGSLSVIQASGWLTALTLLLAAIGMATQFGRLRVTRYTHAYRWRGRTASPGHVASGASAGPPRWPVA